MLYLVLLILTCWKKKVSVKALRLEGFNCFTCPRPKCNKKAKRNSGGVCVYYKEKFFGNITLEKLNDKGIIWIKLNKSFLGYENDIFICSCYIPPEDSTVYKQPNSPLFDYDFFEQLSSDTRYYSQFGEVLITGDLNSRTANKLDIIQNINLDRYIDMPLCEVPVDNLPIRSSYDSHCNAFGNRLLTLCKENGVFIVNGRKEQGKFTCFNNTSSKIAASVVDYVIVNFNIFELISYFEILDINEFSDHCPVKFSLEFKSMKNTKTDYSFDKIIWDSTKK